HEYSRLFDGNRIGLTTDTEYRSDGQWRQLASQYGTYGNTSYALDLDYRHYDGVRPNNDLTRTEWFSQIKHQFTPQDTTFFFAEYRDFDSGDNFQYYEPTNSKPDFRITESQKPNLVLAHHHEWSPGVHTLLMAGRFINDQKSSES